MCLNITYLSLLTSVSFLEFIVLFLLSFLWFIFLKYGTLLYKSPEQDYHNPTKKIEWKQNRTFIFCGIPTVTWHSFYAKNGSEKRFTLASFVRAENWKKLKREETANKKSFYTPSEYEKLKLKLKKDVENKSDS